MPDILSVLIYATPPFVVAFIVSLAIGPLVIRLLKRWKIGQTIQEDGPESHKQKAGTPTMGGAIIVTGILAGIFLSCYPIGILEYSMDYTRISCHSLIALVVLMLCYAIIGLVDDYLTIKPIRGIRGIASKPKAAIQFLLAVGFVLWLRHIGFEPIIYLMGKWWHLGDAYWLLATLLIAGMANFVNITDGLDGLVSGLTIIASISFFTLMVAFFVAYGRTKPDTATIVFMSNVLFTIAGACAAFLIYNRYPAKVFMGDTGSLALGALLPGIAIIMHREILMVAVGLVFILDGLSSALQWAVFKYTRIRTGTGRRVFLKSPVHHHFEMLGWPEQRVVIMFWICGVIAAVLGFAGAAMGWW